MKFADAVTVAILRRLASICRCRRAFSSLVRSRSWLFEQGSLLVPVAPNGVYRRQRPTVTKSPRRQRDWRNRQ